MPSDKLYWKTKTLWLNLRLPPDIAYAFITSRRKNAWSRRKTWFVQWNSTFEIAKNLENKFHLECGK